MSLARITISGSVSNAPEKRFTSNNIPITTFMLNISDNEETLIRVVARGNLAETIENTINKNDMIVVEGRLQNATTTTANGVERKTVEVDASAVMKTGQTSNISTSTTRTNVSNFAQEEFSEELIGENEIPF